MIDLFLIDFLFLELGPYKVGLLYIFSELEPESFLHYCFYQIPVVTSSDVQLEWLLVFLDIQLPVYFMGQIDHENKLLKFINLGDDAIVLVIFKRSQFFGGKGFMFVDGFVDDVRVYLWFFNNLLRSGTHLVVGRLVDSFSVGCVQFDEFIHPMSFHEDSILIVVTLEYFCTFYTAVFVSFHNLPPLGF